MAIQGKNAANPCGLASILTKKWQKSSDKKHGSDYYRHPNLNYVDNVTKNCVTLKYGDKKYVIYASSRKIGSFKEALLKLKNIDISTD